MKGLSPIYTIDCSLPGSSVYRILQARILEWVVIYMGCSGAQYRRPDSEWAWVSAWHICDLDLKESAESPREGGQARILVPIFLTG